MVAAAARLGITSLYRRYAMPEISSLLTFALVALGLVLTPGPNMIYLISRSICQGRRAGLVSLGGVALGFVFICCAPRSVLPH
jgi:hypothetical protein